MNTNMHLWVPLILILIPAVIAFWSIVIKDNSKSQSHASQQSELSLNNNDFYADISTNDNIKVMSAFTYKGATIQYKVKVENPTSDPIGDVKVNLYVPNVFILSDSTKHIPIIKPSESQTVTFDIRPTGECGDCEVSGKIIYYDYKSNETTETPIPSKNVSIICPMLKSKEISESDWRNALSGLTNAEENTKELDIPASTLFDVTSDVLQDMNLFMLPPKVNDSDNFYRATSKFYGEGVKELRYAAQIEVVGGSSKSKLILKAWAESEDALTGFYHGILDEIEKRVHIKGLIDSNVVYNYHYGDNIGTQITDSLIQRSFNTETKAEAAHSNVKISSQKAEEIRIPNDKPLATNVNERSNAPKSVDFQKELLSALDIAEKEGEEYLDVTSGDLHRAVGGYHGNNHRMPVCCGVMKKLMSEDDEILQQPSSGCGATLVIRYHLPRIQTIDNSTNIGLMNEAAQSLNNLSLRYRGSDIYSFNLTASKVVANVKMEKLTELLVGIAEILKTKKNSEHFVRKNDCEHLCSNYTDFQNLLYQMGLLDKIGHGKYILTNEGTKVAEGEHFCKHLPEALLNLVKFRKEEDRHALLLLWIYYQASLNGQPRPEHFQKADEDNSYPKIRYEVGKTMMFLLSNCFGNDMDKIHAFFEEWEQLLD